MTSGWLKRAVPRTAAEVAVLVAVFGAGVLAGARFRPEPSDWLGFMGALVGASMTVAGSVYVLERERKRGEREQRELLLALLDEIDAACVPFQVANQNALVGRYGITARGQAEVLKGCVTRLHIVGQEVKPTSVRMMKVVDAIAQVQVDPDLDGQAAAAGMYPESGDFGALNAIGHDIRQATGTVRDLLKS